MVLKQEISDFKYEFRSSEPENVAVLYLLNEDKPICMAIFTSEDYLPPPREGMHGIVYTTYRCEWLPGILDMLRNKEPVFFTWDKNLKIARITTEDKIVGEEEHKSLFRYVFGE